MKKPNKYEQSVKDLFQHLGGYANIESYSNCMTRMRFHLKDWTIVNEQAIKADEFVITINKNQANGEFQVVIGPDVENYKIIFNKMNHYNEQNKPILNDEKRTNFEVKQESEIKGMKAKFHIKGSMSKVLAFISKVFSPIVVPLVGYGLILTLWSVMAVDWSGPNSSAAANSHFANQLEAILADVFLSGFGLFITILVGYTTFKAMNKNGIYGIIIAIILTVPSLTTMGDVKPSDGESIIEAYPGWTLFGSGTTYPWKINFNGLIIPMIFVALFGVFLENQTDKISNTTARMILAPVIILSGTFIVAVFIIAPIGMLFTNYLSIGINWLSTNDIAKYIAIPIVGMLYGPLVITGLHHSLTPIILQAQAIYGASLIQGFITISNVTQGVCSIAFVILHNRVLKMRNLGVSNGFSAIVGGITEPSLYTINLKHLFPLIGASIGTLVGTILLVASNTYALQGASSIFGILMYLQNAPVKTGVTTWIGGGYLWGTLSILLASGVGFTTTYFLGKTKFFWNKSRSLILNDFNEDIDLLKQIPSVEWKVILKNNHQAKLALKQSKKVKKINK